MTDCPHENFDAQVNVKRVTSPDSDVVRSYIAEIAVRCSACKKPFQFLGTPVGLLYDRPCAGVDALIMRLPMIPLGEVFDAAGKLPGFIITPDNEVETVP